MKRYAKKSLGQNFLIDPNIIKKIINLTNVSDKNILESLPDINSSNSDSEPLNEPSIPENN